MNLRRIFRDYARKKEGKIAKEFVEIIPELYNQDTLVTKDDKGIEERCIIDYKDLLLFISKEYKIIEKPTIK